MTKGSGQRKFKKPTVPQTPKPRKIETQVFEAKFWLKKIKGASKKIKLLVARST